ncbi:hypothetical protein H2202_004144 [Exophiala xenobiotica]|nr:hypothetical protein H2202_004144 [Exophiala xenobiotica]
MASTPIVYSAHRSDHPYPSDLSWDARYLMTYRDDEGVLMPRIVSSQIASFYLGVGWRYRDCIAYVDFPAGSYPEKGYVNPPSLPSPATSFNDSAFAQLPPEIRQEIYNYILHNDWDDRGRERVITVLRSCSGRLHRYQSFLPRRLEGLLLSCKTLHADLLEYLMESTRFKFECGTRQWLKDTPYVWGYESLKLVRYLDMSSHYYLLTRPETHFANLLRVLTTGFPNLQWLRFSSEWETSSVCIPYEETKDKDRPTRHQQEMRTLLLLGAWLALRHKNMDLLTCSPVTTSTNRWNEPTTRVWIEVMDKDLVRSMASVEDQVLDTPKIRRTAWSDLAMLSIQDLTIDRKSESSELMQAHAGFEKLDLEGYTSHFTRGRKWIRSIPVDRLIKICSNIGTTSQQLTESNARGSDNGMRSRGSATRGRANSTRGRGSNNRSRGSIRHGRGLATHGRVSGQTHESSGGW